MNFVHIVGRLAKDPETRFTSGGQKVTTMVIATNSYRAGNEVTIWWRATLWGDRFDKMVQYFSKGKPIMVGGEMRKPEMYTDKGGQQQIGAIEINADYIKFVPFGKSDQQEGQDSSGGQQQGQSQGGGGYGADQQFGQASEQGFAQQNNDNSEEDLPF